MLHWGLGQRQRARWDNPDPNHIGGTGHWESIRFASKSRSQQPLHPQNLPLLCTDDPNSSMSLCQWGAGPRKQGGLLKWSRSSVGARASPTAPLQTSRGMICSRLSHTIRHPPPGHQSSLVPQCSLSVGCVGRGQVHFCWMKAQPLWLRGRVCVGSQELEPGCAAPCSPSLPSCASGPSYLIK